MALQRIWMPVSAAFENLLDVGRNIILSLELAKLMSWDNSLLCKYLSKRKLCHSII